MGLHWADNTIEIAASPDEVFDAITDYESFPEWITAVYEVEVKESDKDGLGEIVSFVADGKVRKIRYTLQYHYERPNRIWWDFLDGEGIKQMDGEWNIEESGDGTAATYKVGVDAGRGIPGPVVKRSNKQTIAAVNKELKAEAERRSSQTAGSGASSRFERSEDEAGLVGAGRTAATAPDPRARERQPDPVRDAARADRRAREAPRQGARPHRPPARRLRRVSDGYCEGDVRENVEIVRQGFELFRNRDTTAESGLGERDAARAVEFFHPDLELDTTRVPMADLRGIHRGPVEVAEFWRRWLEAWETVEVEFELTGAGDQVLAEVKQNMRGKGSGIEIEFPDHWQVFTFREGRIIGHTIFLDEAEALEAAGLSG